MEVVLGLLLALCLGHSRQYLGDHVVLNDMVIAPVAACKTSILTPVFSLFALLSTILVSSLYPLCRAPALTPADGLCSPALLPLLIGQAGSEGRRVTGGCPSPSCVLSGHPELCLTESQVVALTSQPRGCSREVIGHDPSCSLCCKKLLSRELLSLWLTNEN